MDKYALQLNYPNTFGSSKTSSILIISQLMIKANFQQYIDALAADSNLSYFTSTGIPTSDRNYDDVLYYANLFIQ